MSEKQQVQLLLNDNQYNHGQVIAQMILGAKQLECVVAFAKISGLKFLLKNLEKSLGKGLKARFSIGLVDLVIKSDNHPLNTLVIRRLKIDRADPAVS